VSVSNNAFENVRRPNGRHRRFRRRWCAEYVGEFETDLYNIVYQYV